MPSIISVMSLFTLVFSQLQIVANAFVIIYRRGISDMNRSFTNYFQITIVIYISEEYSFKSNNSHFPFYLFGNNI